MIDSVRRRLGDGEDIVKEFIKNSKEQLEEISFIVFYAYFIEESSSFKTFLRSFGAGKVWSELVKF
uniref:HEPN domain-containing protein n=1 Tax=Meloidogyne hapla TaxID=6305 RepID=A0A1I8BF43_MELHA